MTVPAFLDANVLYPAAQRSLMMELALAGAFRPLWSAKVHDEWTAALARERPDIPQARIDRTRRMMLTHIDDAMVTGYEPLIETLTLPDPDDRHVLAAAIRGQAKLVVTANTKDFPEAALSPHGITAIHPDAFVFGLLTDAPDAVIAALQADRASLRNPPLTAATYLETFARVGLVDTVAVIRALAVDV